MLKPVELLEEVLPDLLLDSSCGLFFWYLQLWHNHSPCGISSKFKGGLLQDRKNVLC